MCRRGLVVTVQHEWLDLMVLQLSSNQNIDSVIQTSLSPKLHKMDFQCQALWCLLDGEVR